MEQERTRALCGYLQTDLCLTLPFWETLQIQPELAVVLYKKLARHSEQLHSALKEAFPDEYSLRELIELELGEDFGDISNRDSFNAHIFYTIKWAEQKGYLLELIAAASKRKPNNPYLRKFIQRILCPLLEEIITMPPSAFGDLSKPLL